MKLIFGVAVIIVAIYLGVEFVPPYYANYEFADAVKNEALFGTNQNTTEDVIRENVYKKAQQLEIPITKEAIMVRKVGTMGVGSVTIDAPYTVHLDLVAFPTDLHFDTSSTNKGAFR
jgi:type III secretion system FlhB-like substrate exporter